MIIGRSRFNINLLLLFAVLLAVGCQSAKSKREKQLSTLRIHVEVPVDSASFSTSVPVYRENPVIVTVNRSPFLTEEHVTGAKVVDAPGGGFDLEIKFNRQGTWLLESYTTSNVGKHMAIHCEFGEKKFIQARWLAAPIIEKRNSKGVLTFTPDATRWEAEEIAIGLSNVAKNNEEASKW